MPRINRKISPVTGYVRGAKEINYFVRCKRSGRYCYFQVPNYAALALLLKRLHLTGHYDFDVQIICVLDVKMKEGA